MIDQKEINKIRNVLIVAEQGRQHMDYGGVYIYHDGPKGVAQLTLSIGFTQYGNLGAVLKAYSNAGGEHSERLGAFADEMHDPATVHNQVLIKLLKDAGKDPVMQKTQEDCFDVMYLRKGIDWGEKEGFTLPLSFLVICDSFLHSGSILQSIRNRFAERTPTNGGREKTWIEQYIKARHNWLANHSIKLLHNTVYRTRYYQDLIAKDDWDLTGYHLVEMNGTKPLLA